MSLNKMSKIGFIFPGQGAYRLNIFNELYKQSSFKKEFDRLFLGLNIINEKFIAKERIDLDSASISQPFIVAVSLVLDKFLKKHGIIPDIVMGHSLGEYAALASAGFISDEEIVRLAYQRGLIMEQFYEESLNNGLRWSTYAVIGATSNTIKEICSGVNKLHSRNKYVEPVNFNSDKQTVIAGGKIAVEEALKELNKIAIKSVLISNKFPFHTSHMRVAALKFREHLEQYKFSDKGSLFIANTDCGIKMGDAILKEELYTQFFSPVNWYESMYRLKMLDTKLLFEIGLGRTLSALAKEIDKNVNILNISSMKDIETAKCVLGR